MSRPGAPVRSGRLTEIAAVTRAALLRPYRRAVRATAAKTRRLTRALGFHVIPRTWEEPVPDVETLDDAFWARRSEMVGVRIDVDEQLALLASFADRFGPEYATFPREKQDDPRRFYLANGAYPPVDAGILYCMIRHLQPRLMIEVGSGFSTLLAAAAFDANRRRDGVDGTLCTIDPYPRRRFRRAVRRGLDGLTELVQQPVQAVPLEEFDRLGPNDILFIDSSHVVKTGSDVTFLFLEVLPRLRPGVYVHVHDVYLPFEYPRSWVEEDGRYLNEQYLLQAFLAHNDSWKTVWAGRLIQATHEDALRTAFPWYRGRGSPGSYWIHRVG